MSVDTAPDLRLPELPAHDRVPHRTAVAAGRVVIGPDAFEALSSGRVAKGDVLRTAQIAGMLGARQASKLIPFAYDTPVTGIELTLEPDADQHAIEIRAIVKTSGTTGVEMEALTAVSVAALTVYDMLKSISKRIDITDVRLLAKTGGQSGSYLRA